MNNSAQTAEAIAEAGGPSKVAEELKVSAQAVCFWRDGKRTMPPEHGATLERLSPRKGCRWHVWPDDWHRIWPELIGTEGAPDVPAVAREAA